MSELDAVAHQTVERRAVDDGTTVERALRRAMLRALAVSVPLAIVTMVGLVALAIRGRDPDWAAWLGMAAGIGVLAGTFFGAMAGFLKTVPLFEDPPS